MTHTFLCRGAVRLLGCALLVTTLAAVAAPHRRADDSDAVPVAPLELVYARPYEVEKALTFQAAGEEVEVKQGWVLVLKADLKLLQPVNAPDFVLFIGDCVGQRINSGYKDGYLVVIAPQCTLEKTPLWFGGRHLPDQLTKVEIENEWKTAAAAGIRPFEERLVKVACKRGGDEVIKARDMNELWYLQRDLILQYAPAEKDMAMSLRSGR